MRLLLVEDKDSFRRLLVQSLAGTDWDPCACATPEEALRALGTESFEVMVTDLRLPGLSGLELLQRAKRLHPCLRVVLMSAYGEPKDIVQAIHAGADDFLPKPFDLDQFLALLERLRGLSAAPPPDPREPWIAASPALRALDQALMRAAENDAPALFWGEPGTGRQRAARRLHCLRHPGAPFLALAAGKLPTEELPRSLRLAAGGSVLLTDLEELPREDLPRILAALEQPDAPHWMATARDPRELPEPLRLRLGVLDFALPPLRQRQEDVLPLFRLHLEGAARLEGRPAPHLERGAERNLLRRAWPGNLRELAWCAAQALRSTDSPLLAAVPQAGTGAAPLCLPRPAIGPLEAMLAQVRAEAEGQFLSETLRRMGGRLPESAAALGLTPRTLAQRLREHRISLDDGEDAPPPVMP